ncbi:MAG: dihydrolipoyl dehydrogenase [Dehalococcoidia bacterium]
MASYDLAVIGSGPGGYVAAIRAAQLGMKTACIEREAVGGVCLNWGCIPSKSLIRNAEVLHLVNTAAAYGITTGTVKADYTVALERSRKVVDRLTRGVGSLFRKNKVDLIKGEAKLTGPHSVSVNGDTIEAKNIIVATGSRPRLLPGITVDGQTVVTYREAIVQDTAPAEAVIIGGGAIGVEFAYVYNAYGAKVTVVEFEPRILPKEDEEVSAALTKALGKQGITFLTGSKVTGVKTAKKGGATVSVETPDGEVSLSADRVLVAVGIMANTEGIGAESAGIELDRGFIKVDGELRANGDGVYAIGDVIGTMPLAHVAQNQGVYVVESIAGEETYPLDYLAMPRAVYCNPQVASLGLSEQEARTQGYEVKVGKFPFIANGKALALDDYDGFAKVVVDARTGELLGAHIIGHEVTEMLGELSLTRLLEGTNIEIGAVVHAHPTISETVKEAALAAEGRAVHM